MNFNKRLIWIRSSLEKAAAKRTALLTKIPELRKAERVLNRELEHIEREMDRLDDKYGRRDGESHEWDLLVEVLEDEAYRVECQLSDARDRLEDAEASLDCLEGHIEATSYDAVDAANA